MKRVQFLESLSNALTVTFAFCVIGAFSRVENGGASWGGRLVTAGVFALLTVAAHECGRTFRYIRRHKKNVRK